jgi:hypothetical protein
MLDLQADISRLNIAGHDFHAWVEDAGDDRSESKEENEEQKWDNCICLYFR